MRFFALNSSRPLGEAIARVGGFPLDPIEERDFTGGEHKTRPLVPVRGHDVFVLSGTHAEGPLSANDRLLRLMFFLATCRDHGAARITALVPSLAYARKDRRTQPHDPLGSRYVAQALEAMGPDAVVTIDSHNLQAFENAFRIPALNLHIRDLVAAAIRSRCEAQDRQDIVIVSPDAGGIKRAQLLREACVEAGLPEAGLAIVEKRRVQDVVSGTLFAGEVRDRAVWILDDMIVGGGTMLRAAHACAERGAAEINLVATHAMMDKAAIQRLADPLITRVYLSDASGMPGAAAALLGPRFELISVAGLLAETIERFHRDPEAPRTPIG